MKHFSHEFYSSVREFSLKIGGVQAKHFDAISLNGKIEIIVYFDKQAIFVKFKPLTLFAFKTLTSQHFSILTANKARRGSF